MSNLNNFSGEHAAEPPGPIKMVIHTFESSNAVSYNTARNYDFVTSSLWRNVLTSAISCEHAL